MLGIIITLAAIQACIASLGVIFFITTPEAKRRLLLPIGLLLIASASTDIAGFVLFFAFQKGSNWLQNIYNLTEVVLILMYFKNVTAKGGQKVNFFNLSIAFFLILSIVNLTSFQGFHTINSYTKAIGGLLIIVFSMSYFYYLIQNLPAQRLSELPSFWITTGVLVYASGAFVLFIFTDYLINVMKDNLVYYWGFHNFLVITKHVMILIGLWKNRQTHNLA